jgi:ABC-type multidrug transport system ATPase subunit
MIRSEVMSKPIEIQNSKSQLLMNEIHLDNVTLKKFGRDPILHSVSIALPTDQTLVIESSNHQNAVDFLQLIAGRLACESGQILWDGENIFNADNDLDINEVIACYFDGYIFDRHQNVEDFLAGSGFDFDAYDIFDQFEIKSIGITKLGNLPYAMCKLVLLIRAVLNSAQALILEDPASGLSEHHWLQLMDLIQYQQRRGHFRHVYMTNHHPTALRHLAYNQIYIEDGLIYFDESAGYKKASHF